MVKKFYTNKQRLYYGIGWCLISLLIGAILNYYEWKVLSYIAFAFGAMSLFAIKNK